MIRLISFINKTAKKYLKLKDKTFLTSDGYELSYSDNEAVEKPVMFIIHGHIFARYTFFPLAYIFRKEYRTILVDIPGYTESSCFPDGDYRFLSQAKRFDELINHLKLEKVNLVSTSLGGAISIVLNGISSKIHTSTLFAPFGMPLYTQELPEILKYYLEEGKVAFVIDKPYDIKKMKKLFYFGSNIPTFLQADFLQYEVKELLESKTDSTNKLNKDVLYDKASLISIFKEHPMYSQLAKEYNINLDHSQNDDYDLATDFILKYNKNKKISKIDPIGNNYEDVIPYLQKIENKVLVIWGKTDKIIHYKTIETMKPHLKNGVYKLYNKGSHVLFMLNAFKASKDMKTFLKEAN